MRKIIIAFVMMLCAACVASAANYLTFTAEEDSSSFRIVNNGSNNPDVQYSLDGGETWTALAGGKMVTLAHKGDKALLRGDNPEGFSKDTKKYSSFTMTGMIAASGSVMSLIDGVGETLVIPANYCFYNLFVGCKSLTKAPELPATTLTEWCYCEMFDGCTSLTQAPALPATTLADFCYSSMFRGCTSLSQIRVSFDDWNDGLHTDRWVADVAPTGTFICPKALALEYGEDRIPEGWTVKYIGEEGSGVSSALADGITVWIDGLTVYVRGAEGEVSLYDMSGRIVAASNTADEERVLCVPAKGAYVVRTNGGSSVVLVR